MYLAHSKNYLFKITCTQNLQDRFWRIMVKNPTHNHIIMYPETHPIHCKLTVEDKLNIKVISTANTISNKIVNKLQLVNSGYIFI